MKVLLYRLSRFIVKIFARPSLTGADNIPPHNMEVVYVLHHRAVTDLVVLEMVCSQNNLVSPFEVLEIGNVSERNRFFSLFRAKAGRMILPSQSARMRRLVSSDSDAQSKICLVPVSVFWGRAMSNEGAWLSNLTSEDWAVTGRFKRLLNLLINRKNIQVHTGRPIVVADISEGHVGEDERAEIIARRTSRILRVRLRQQKETTLGPDFSHRRTLVEQVVSSSAVKEAIDAEISSGVKTVKAERIARKYARTIASDMSHPTVRVLARILRWFWTKIYDGIEVTGIEGLEEISATHSLVYLPSHRSHLDYLLLSYLLYYRGFAIPHIAAGDNLNLPILGGILRRGGAFFMRRTFKDNPLYAAVFSEYLYQVYRRGHSVEFFPEGGRTRTGRLLPIRLGLLKMSVDHQRRGLPKPLALVPVYFGYEKVVEGSSYLSELRGADKKSESIMDLFRNLKLIRQNFGSVKVNLGPPTKLDTWLEHHSTLSDTEQLQRLGQKIMVGINRQANINPVNLVALVTLCTPKVAIEEAQLKSQITCYKAIIKALHRNNSIEVCTDSVDEIIEHVEHLGLLNRDEESYGAVFTHSPFSAVLMTWYRNNVVHAFALPSLVACLMVKRRRSISSERLHSMVSLIFPYLAAELSWQEDESDFQDCLNIMVSLGLLVKSGDSYVAPSPANSEYLQLTLLANLVSQTLERMFIVIHQLALRPADRETLLATSQLTAQRISKLYGINAPEFSDQRLFDQFLQSLERQGVVDYDGDGKFSYDPIIERVLRAAEFVIDPQIRHGVMSVSPQT